MSNEAGLLIEIEELKAEIERLRATIESERKLMARKTEHIAEQQAEIERLRAEVVKQVNASGVLFDTTLYDMLDKARGRR